MSRNTSEEHYSESESNPNTAKHVCNECKRRKLRCNRALPACFQCSRHRRHCLYEKERRSPLTRRHLTEVEEELARVKAKLQQLSPKAFITAPSSPNNTTHILRSQLSTQVSQFFDVNETDSPSLPSQTLLDDDELANFPSDTQQLLPGLLGSRRDKNNLSSSRKSTIRNLELPPAQGLFEWDERMESPDEESSVDGMAILTSESDKGGYLGVVSGAALLRLAKPDTGTSSAFPRRRSQTGNMTASLPRSIFVNTPTQLASYVDAYFQTYHLCYPIVHEPTFRAQLMEVIPRPSSPAWKVLLYVLAALGAFSSSTTSTTIDQVLFKEAEKHFSIDMLQTGSILLVQAIALMANYLQKRNKPNSGYNYLGLARRIAMGIGLHKELNVHEGGGRLPHGALLRLEEKRRTWWCLFVFDAGATITFSRPMDFPSGGIEVDLPLNVNDCDLTAATIHSPTSNETTLYTHLRSHSGLHMATSRIYSRIISSPFPSAGELIELDDICINDWLASIPSFFSETTAQTSKFVFCHSMLSWRYRNFHILMYRPFVIQRMILDLRTEDVVQESHQQSTTDVAIQRCCTAAAETIHLISTFWSYSERRNLLACWYALYFLFQAVMIPVICLRNDPQAAIAFSWREQIRKSIETLKEMVGMSSAAERCLGAIDALCGGLLEQDDDLQVELLPTDESPRTQLNNLYPLLWAPILSENFDEEDAAMQDPSIMDFFNQFPVFDVHQHS